MCSANHHFGTMLIGSIVRVSSKVFSSGHALAIYLLNSLEIFIPLLPNWVTTNSDIIGTPLSASDNVWAVCFSLIILLSLGAQPSDSGTDSEFLKPFLSTIIRGLGSTAILLTAQLINLQTLALLVF